MYFLNQDMMPSYAISKNKYISPRLKTKENILYFLKTLP